MSDVIPINLPSRVELWRRNQLALSILGHREFTLETVEILGRVLRGEESVELPGGAA
ncbi:hypothetical protein N8J89_07920 [Crossiella sp. CA-258035]|uniref:hypothetical protein n=1 Tax=Crossiella sp. CA-258035 TaxID=2981138 RepID=UPI0024BC8217|nr:hypothetical protein [Crossiella sp. CA-258035]WHT20981.1 hypothetical protein N8J89_07920 [Crossiella sp. CA-258035]